MTGILLETKDDGAFVTFNRPEISNALNPDMLSAVSRFLASLEDDRSVRYLVFQGAGANFSAGGDLAVYSRALELAPPERRTFFETRVRGNAECFLRLDALSIPVISVVRGAAAGAGLSFVLASDFVLSADDAMLLFAQSRVGLPLDLSLTYYLPRTVGTRIACQLAMTGARLDAERARQIGIIDEIHPADQLDEALARLARSFVSVAPRATARSKRLLKTADDFSLAEQMEREVQAIGECVGEPDFREGVQAFLEKRRASFSGADGPSHHET